MREPVEKRAIAFLDGQNLFRHAKDAFGHHHPNFDLLKLHGGICARHGWMPVGIRFYTGIPTADRDPFWHGYWERRMLGMSRAGIHVTTRPLRYRDIDVFDSQGNKIIRSIAQEKGIDVRIALNILSMAIEGAYDVAVIFSQDQDLAEVVSDVRRVARIQNRWIKLACAFPAGQQATSSRDIHGTDWIRMAEEFYNSCLYPRDYRPTRKRDKSGR